LKESTQGLTMLKNARYVLWSDIADLIAREWEKLLDYQRVKEQVSNTSERIKTLDSYMEQQEENANKMLLALDNLSDRELEAIDVTNKKEQLKNAQRILRKLELINEARAMRDNLAQRCREFRQRFDKCIQYGLPFLFYSNHDVYAEDRFIHNISNITRDESLFSKMTGVVTSFDFIRILRKPQEILSMLRENFANIERPDFAKATALDLSTDMAEEYKYPLGTPWNTFRRCVKLYHDKLAGKEKSIRDQAEGSGSKGKRPAKKSVASVQQQAVSTDPVSFAPPLLQPQGENLPQQLQGTTSHVSLRVIHPQPPT
jgi:hypothetical protein